MEAFVVLIAECLVAPLLAGLVLVLEALFAVLAGVAQWIAGSASRRKSAKTGAGNGPKFFKLTAVLLFGLLVVTLAGTFAVNTFWFEPAVRFVLERVEQRKQIKVTFESASGNFFTGDIELHQASIARKEHPTSTFSLTAEHIDADLNLWQIAQRKPVLDHLHITGLEGNFERIGKVKRVKPRREFRILDLTLEDATIQVKDHTRARLPVDLEVRVDKLQSKPFRSTHMIYDALLRSKAGGTINGSPLSIGERPSEESRSSRWNLENLRLDRMGDYLFGDWNFVQEGILDIDVNHTFSSSVPAEVDMNWKLSFSEIHIRRPGKLVKRFSRLRDKIEDYLERHGREFSFEFAFSLSEDQFINRPTLEAAGVWKKFREKSAKKAAATFTALKERAIQATAKGKERIKKFLEKRRRKKEAEKEE
jgi:hypothetical protein